MKLSNKILLGFFGFIFLYMTAAFAELRINGTPNVIDKTNSIAETVGLSGGIRYLVLNNLDREVKLIGSNVAQLEVRSFSGNVLNKLKYKISGDTLILSGIESEDHRPIQISVFVPESGLKGVTIKSSTLIIEGLRQELLNISGNAGRVWMEDNRIGRIETDLSNRSFLDIGNTKLDTVSAKIDESQMHISSPVRLVEGFVQNKSFLQLNEIGEIRLKKDESSRLNMYQ